MKHDEFESLTLEEARAREAFRALDTPADAAFRERLKHEFVRGTLESRLGAGGARTPAARPAGRRPSWLAAPLVRWVAVPAAAAALVVVVTALNRGPRWEVASASGMGVAVVDGLPVPMNHVADLQRLLRPGVRIQVPEGAELMLASAGQAVMQVTSGTDLTVPQSPGRWFSRDVHAEVRSGELRVTSGPRFRGARLSIMTPEAMVRMTGTTIAVICDFEGTCVCVLEGRTEVGSRSGERMTRVEEGKHLFVFNDDRESDSGDIRPDEVAPLTRLREEGARILGGSGPEGS